VLMALAQGKSRHEIAIEMTIGERTVKCHVEHICEKLCARRAIHAVAIAYEMGLLIIGDAARGGKGG
jgi:DNA-binding NarL/FixJ family response regulator